MHVSASNAAKPDLNWNIRFDERIVNLSTPLEVTNTVASGRDTPATTVAILLTLQTLLPSNLSG